MQVYDKVRVLKDTDYYSNNGVYKGMIGRIISGKIRDNRFDVCFIDPKFYDNTIVWTDETIKDFENDKFCDIKIEDLELVEKGFANDKMILEELPKQDPRWWCKVENGYILNLLGEKKNKIPYDYNS